MSPGSGIDVAVIGGGPAGLTAARRLREDGAGRVVVIERECEAGGIPRHANHQGYGIRDLRRAMSGPRYARTLVERALAEGVEIETSTQATGWGADGAIELTGPGGRTALRARAIVLATGCRERPGAARGVAGYRPHGVMTTGTLQQLVYLNREPTPGRAVVVGAEHVAFSALQTLRHGGAEPVAMTTEGRSHESYAAFRAGAALVYGVPLLTRTRVARILGRERVEAVEMVDLDSGASRRIPCGLVVFTGDWIPDHELAVGTAAEIDPGTLGPRVDLAMQTTARGVFAVGNLLHGAETADVAALSGARVSAGVLSFLAGDEWSGGDRVEILCEPPLKWAVPGALSATAAGRPPHGPRRPFLVRADRDLFAPKVEIAQDGRVISRERLVRIGPARSARMSSRWLSRVRADGGPLWLRLLSGRSRS